MALALLLPRLPMIPTPMTPIPLTPIPLTPIPRSLIQPTLVKTLVKTPVTLLVAVVATQPVVSVVTAVRGYTVYVRGELQRQ